MAGYTGNTATKPALGTITTYFGRSGVIYPGTSSSSYRNRVWDTVEGGHVRWDTDAADDIGAEYPGPGAFGVDTSDYCVERTT